MANIWSHTRIGSKRGFTLTELMVVVAVIAILAAIAIPLYVNVQQRARLAKAQADTRAIASAAAMYSAHQDELPPANLDWLIVPAVNSKTGQSAGPFMNSLPTPPAGWTYEFKPNTADGTFTVTATGEGKEVVDGQVSTAE